MWISFEHSLRTNWKISLGYCLCLVFLCKSFARIRIYKRINLILCFSPEILCTLELFDPSIVIQFDFSFPDKFRDLENSFNCSCCIGTSGFWGRCGIVIRRPSSRIAVGTMGKYPFEGEVKLYRVISLSNKMIHP